MKKLNFFATSSIDELAQPMMAKELSEYSSALSVLNDFAEQQPLLIEASATAVDAENIMHQSHVSVMLVVDQDGHFIGLINTEDLNEQGIMKKLSKGFKRSELLVSDFMRPKSQLQAFDYKELSAASIVDVINTFKESGQQLGLVIDRQLHSIRGLLSTSDIAKKLRLPVDIEVKASFSHVLAQMHH